MKNSFRLYSNVIPVKGYNRSSLCDLFTNSIHLVPNSLIEFLEELVASDLDYEEYISQLNENEKSVAKEYISFLVSKNLGLVGDMITLQGLTAMSNKYYPTSQIMNAIIEVGDESRWNITKAISELDLNGTMFLELRFLSSAAIQTKLKEILIALNDTTIQSIHLLTPFSESLQDQLNQSITLLDRIYRITVYNSQTGFQLNNTKVDIRFSSQESISNECCGNVAPEHFSINPVFYSITSNYNSCLAFKISIDQNGIVKNCPSLTDQYGLIDQSNLSEIVAKEEFKKYWQLTKMEISVCKDCEFRYVCTDCRAFSENSFNTNKPIKCTYNPYISLWSDEPGYVHERELSIMNEAGDVLIDHERVENLNASVWA